MLQVQDKLYTVQASVVARILPIFKHQYDSSHRKQARPADPLVSDDSRDQIWLYERIEGFDKPRVFVALICEGRRHSTLKLEHLDAGLALL